MVLPISPRIPGSLGSKDCWRSRWPSSWGHGEVEDKTQAVTLACIDNPVGGDSIGNAIWEGVTLKKVLELAGPKSGISKVVFYGG